MRRLWVRLAEIVIGTLTITRWLRRRLIQFRLWLGPQVDMDIR